MPEPKPGWDLYRTFLAVIRGKTLSAAARNLGLAQPTAGRHIQDLEKTLGTALFVRSRRGLVPTPAALAIVPYAEAMSAAAAAVHRLSSAETQDERGVVRVTAGQLVAGEVLPAILADFCVRFPRIELEISVSDQNEDLLRREADIAVRMLRPIQGELVARRIGTVELGLFAHRRYVDSFGIPRTAEDLLNHRMIGFDRDAHAIRSAGGAAAKLRREQFGFRCDNNAVQIAAMYAGVGIGGYHVQLARRNPDLVRVLESEFRFKREMWLAVHRDARATRRTRLLFDFLAARLAGYINQGAAEGRRGAGRAP
jgi:DNA-binding transcriptional LysR family regulator